jgi:hypothetical protein
VGQGVQHPARFERPGLLKELELELDVRAGARAQMGGRADRRAVEAPRDDALRGAQGVQ